MQLVHDILIYIVYLSPSNWMDGPMENVDPDAVENETGIFWRTLYKLEKSFQESPNPLKMAQKVKGRVDDFKEHLPMIGALFNPGLRDRHWEKMSTIAEQDLRPNEVGGCCVKLYISKGKWWTDINSLYCCVIALNFTFWRKPLVHVGELSQVHLHVHVHVLGII